MPTPATPHTTPAQLALKLQDGSLSEPWTSQVEVIQPYQYVTWQELVLTLAHSLELQTSTESLFSLTERITTKR